MKNVDKKYTPPPRSGSSLSAPLPRPPSLSLSLTEFLHFVVNALAAKRKTICSHLSCWAGSAARDGEGETERERKENMYVIAFVVVVREGAPGGRGWC